MMIAALPAHSRQTEPANQRAGGGLARHWLTVWLASEPYSFLAGDNQQHQKGLKKIGLFSPSIWWGCRGVICRWGAGLGHADA